MNKDIGRMIVASARLLEDNRSVFVGTGMPLLASILAKKLYAPGLLMVYEGGGVGGQPTGRLPIQVSESLTYQNGIIVGSMDYVMGLAQAGFVDFGFLGGAELDPYGNLNTTVIGDWQSPRVRLPGSGGGADIASFTWRNIILMRQDAKKFVPQLTFVTSPGYLSGPGAREAAGLPTGTGPWRVVTQLGVYGFPEKTRRLTLLKAFAGVRVPDDIQAQSGFSIEIDPDWEIEPDPEDEEMLAMEALDASGLVIA